MPEISRIPVAHLRRHYLLRTETFVHAFLRCARRYDPHVMTEVAHNLDEATVGCTYLLRSDELPDLRRRLPGPGMRRLLRRLDYPTCFAKRIQEKQCRILHAHFADAGLASLELRRQLGLPLIVSFYGIDASAMLDAPGMRASFDRLFGRGDRFIVLGASMARRLADAGCSEEKIRTVHLGVFLDRIPFRLRSGVRKRPVILFCGRLVEKKRPEDAIAATAALVREGLDVSLRIVGDGPLRTRLEAVARDRGIAGRVRFTGALKHAEVLAEMQRADVFVLPSSAAKNGDSEGTPTVLLEAQASGLPVVSTRHADIPEVVRDGRTGFLVEERRPDALARRISDIVTTPHLSESLGRAGRAHVAASYDIRRESERLEQVYDEVLESRKGRRHDTVHHHLSGQVRQLAAGIRT